MTAELDEILARLPGAGNPTINNPASPEERAHDAYFGVNRVAEDDAPGVLLRSVLSARRIFLREVEEAAVTIPGEQLERIDRAFADLLSCLLGETVNRGRSVTAWNSCPATLRRHAALGDTVI